MQRLSTWQVLNEVDRLLKDSPGWKPLNWQQPKGKEFNTQSTFLEKQRKRREREARRRSGKDRSDSA